LKSAAFRAVVAVMAALSAGALLSLALRGKSNPFTSAMGVLLRPVQGLSASAAGVAEDFCGYFRSSHALQERLARQETELANLRQRQVEYDQAMQKLALYEEFLELKKSQPNDQFEPASIIARDPAERLYTFTLDRGSLSGIQVNNPVLSGQASGASGAGQYLVGVVTSVEPTSCVVSTILNPSVNVSAYETVTREIGVVNTTAVLAEQGLCRLPELKRSTAIAMGGLICTSGLGGIYPKDLIIGAVTEVLDDTATISAFAVIQPAVDFSSLRDVMVLTNF
jgi:rod shape-determining protein MreC